VTDLSIEHNSNPQTLATQPVGTYSGTCRADLLALGLLAVVVDVVVVGLAAAVAVAVAVAWEQ
jgi:hypothetical protein